MASLFEWWLCAQWKALCMSASQWRREVLWSILSVIPGRLWRFPFLLSRSRRWDHRTSLHRWQPRLKVSRSRGAYRLLARCEILPCMLSLLVPDPLLPRDMGCYCFPPEAQREKPAICCFYCPPLFFSDQKRKICQPTLSFILILRLSFLWFPIKMKIMTLWPLIYHSGIIKILVPHAPFIKVYWLPSVTLKNSVWILLLCQWVLSAYFSCHIN